VNGIFIFVHESVIWRLHEFQIPTKPVIGEGDQKNSGDQCNWEIGSVEMRCCRLVLIVHTAPSIR